MDHLFDPNYQSQFEISKSIRSQEYFIIRSYFRPHIYYGPSCMCLNLPKIHSKVNFENFDMIYNSPERHVILMKNGNLFLKPNFDPILWPKSKNGHISGTTGPISKIFEI